MAGFLIRDVEGYRPFNRSGTVSNVLTGEPRIFADRGKAQSYATLSHFRNHTIEGIA